MPYITLIIAPDIPESERLALQDHWVEAVHDPDYTLVVNYECYMAQVEIPEDCKVLIVAPGIPLADLDLLRERVAAARAAEDEEERVVVCNYECRIDVLEDVE